MIRLSEVLAIHAHLLELYGGLSGIREPEMLSSALARPFQTFGGEDLYPTIFDKGAAVLESIVRNHPFLDGNKRTGYAILELLLMANSLEITASEDEKYDFVIAVAEGRLDFDGIRSWIEAHV